jgi:hypothetical protein
MDHPYPNLPQGAKEQYKRKDESVVVIRFLLIQRRKTYFDTSELPYYCQRRNRSSIQGAWVKKVFDPSELVS